jgi:hypothetical protein
LHLNESLEIIKKKIEDKQRQDKFAEKFGKSMGMSKREFREQGGIKGMRDML